VRSPPIWNSPFPSPTTWCCNAGDRAGVGLRRCGRNRDRLVPRCNDSARPIRIREDPLPTLANATPTDPASPYGQQTIPFLYAQPAASLVEGISRPNIPGSKSIAFDAWPKSLKGIAISLAEEFGAP